MLGVPQEKLAARTAVSWLGAEAMASGAPGRCPAHVAIAITGVVGPEPKEEDNPVELIALP
jgi:nicotinamide-nucleotide amidase